MSTLTISSMLKDYAQGAAQSAIQPAADFIAPAVNVPTSTGYFKKYNQKSRFALPDTRRASGGRATILQFGAEDGTYNCTPNALDYPVDSAAVSQEEFDLFFRDGATAMSEIAALCHEKKVIDLAIVAAGAGTGKTWGASGDPVTDLDNAILTVIKAAKYGSAMGVGVLFGANAFRIFKNAAAVRAKYVVGNAKAANIAIPNIEGTGDLLIGKPECKTSFMVYDTTKEGKAESIDFVLDTAILIFARQPNPTRFDPSFMKTFRLANRWMVPGSYSREDGRAEVIKYDWSEDVQTTNSAAVVRLNITEG